jgi:hypothetical protein
MLRDSLALRIETSVWLMASLLVLMDTVNAQRGLGSAANESTPIAAALREAQALLKQDAASSDGRATHQIELTFSGTEMRIGNQYQLDMGDRTLRTTWNATIPLSKLSPAVQIQAATGDSVNMTLTCAAEAPQCIAEADRRVSEARFTVFDRSRAARVRDLFITAISAARVPADRALASRARKLSEMASVFSLVEQTSFGTTSTSNKVADGVKVAPNGDCALSFSGALANAQDQFEATLDGRESTPTILTSGNMVVVDSLRIAGTIGRSGATKSPRARLMFGFGLPTDAQRAGVFLTDWFETCSLYRH